MRYRIRAHTVGWVQVREFYARGGARGRAAGRARNADVPHARSRRESDDLRRLERHARERETLKALHERTTALKPDFLLWNGDQSNDVHFEKDMAGQFLTPAGLAIAERWPLAYVRGNHDVRGPAARSLPRFTGTPDDRFYYAFRSGPLAALVMDTGEDKPDDSPYFGGMAAFQPMQRRQAEWLQGGRKEPWFREAPFKVLFCHIPL